MGLALLPLLTVRTTFSELSTSDVVAEHPLLEPLTNYSRSTWVDTFRVPFWNMHGQTIRTNNMSEGWHIKKNHPHIQEFVSVLKKEQGAIEFTIRESHTW